MIHVLHISADDLETVLNRVDDLDFDIVAVTASRSSWMFSGGGPATGFTVVVRGDAVMPSDLKPEAQTW